LENSSVQSDAGVLILKSSRSRAAGVLEAAIFYGLIAVIIFTAIPYGTVDPWSQAVFECAVFFIGLLWLGHALMTGSWRVRNLQLVLPMIALVGLAILQSLRWSQIDLAGVRVFRSISADPFETRAFALRLAALILAFVLFVRFTTSHRRLSLLVHALIGLAIVCALFGLARQALQHGDGFLLTRLKPGVGYAQFINKDHFSYLMEMAFGLTVSVAFMPGNLERIPLYLSGVIIMWAALVLSSSRGGLLAMTIQVVLAAFLFLTSRKKARGAAEFLQGKRRFRSALANVLVTVVLVMIMIAGVAWLGGDQLATAVETASIEMGGADTSELHEAARRRDIWRASWRMFLQHPIAGAGLAGYWAEVPAFHEGSGVSTPQQAHNDYLEMLASGGLIGATILIWFVVALIQQTRRNIQSSKGFQHAVSVGAIVGVAGVAVHSVVDFGLHVGVNALVLMALLALLSPKPFKELGIEN